MSNIFQVLANRSNWKIVKKSFLNVSAAYYLHVKIPTKVTKPIVFVYSLSLNEQINHCHKYFNIATNEIILYLQPRSP